MSENTINVVIDYNINEENERLVRDLSESQKKIEFLESYRKIVNKFSEECVCNQTLVFKYMIKTLENKYKNTFDVSHGSDDRTNDEDIQTLERNASKTCDVIQELILRTEESNDKSNDNNSSDETNLRIDGNSDDNNHNLVLVFDKTNNSIVKKRKEEIDLNTEFVINKFVLKKPEDSSVNTTEDMTQSSSEPLTKKRNLTPNEASETTTQISVDKNSELLGSGQTFGSGKILLVLPPVLPQESKSKKSRSKGRSALNSGRKRNFKVLSEDSSDGHISYHLSEEYKENNRVFNQLLSDLKSGKIESFFDRNYNLIKVSLQNDDSSEGNNKVVFSCSEEGCHFVSHTIHSARRHAQRHNKEKSFSCYLCDKRFVMRAYLSQHLEIVHNIKGKPLMRCEFPGCQFRSLTKSQLKSHYFSHSEEKAVKCEHNGCESYFKSVNQMRAHIKLHNQIKEFVCEWPECGAEFKSKAYLKRHSETHTGEGISTTKLKEVLQTGNYMSTVDKNNNLFSVIRQQVLNQLSGRVEIGAQLGFKCNHSGCQFATIFKHVMTQHVSTHLFGKTFECNLCDKKFGLAKYLTQHKKTVHNVDNSPIICCPVTDCQYKTTYRLGLRIHSLTHQTERPFKCDFNGCDKRFKTQVLLRWHKNNRHLKAKPYICDYSGCQSAFEVRDQLKKHIKCHTKQFQCHFDNCSKSYKKKQDFNRHLREKH